jgi:hypothetical protein
MTGSKKRRISFFVPVHLSIRQAGYEQGKMMKPVNGNKQDKNNDQQT